MNVILTIILCFILGWFCGVYTIAKHIKNRLTKIDKDVKGSSNAFHDRVYNEFINN